MACKIEYIKNKYSGIELDIVASLHKQIENELYDPMYLHKFKGHYYEFVPNGSTNIAKVNQSRRKMGEINQRYGAKVITILPTREYMINVLPIAQEYIDKYINKDDGQQTLFFQTDDEVKYALKAVDILSSDKAKQVFEKGSKNNWDLNKILTELAVPKEQKEIILSLDKTKREDILVELAANYSYTIKVKTTKTAHESKFSEDAGSSIEDFRIEDTYYQRYYDSEIGVFEFYKNTNKKGLEPISQEEYTKAANIANKLILPTNYYQSLTVPGGTNYIENEISTPLIIPSIKGHAAFSTDNGIGWFRSDDYRSNKEANDVFSENKYTKTRRILEIQSDLFQKGRDKESLVNYGLDREIEYLQNASPEESGDNRERIQELKELRKEQSKSKENQFLQLLNKDNNWVTFFIKSIIQDSAKKGYETVLFPKGETAAKVEGHETLANEIRKLDEEIRIAKLDANRQEKTKWFTSQISDDTKIYFDTEKEARDYIRNHEYSNEFYSPMSTSSAKNSLKSIQDLEERKSRLKSQGIEKLKPIEAFYEVKITNILKKAGYNPTVITDEYGNQWNEVKIDPIRDNANILLQTKPSGSVGKKNQKLDTLLKEFASINGIKVEYFNTLKDKYNGDYVAVYDSINRVIDINENKEGIDTLGEEVAHSLVEALGSDHALVKRALNLIPADFKNTLDPKYTELYKGNTVALKKEYLGKLIADTLVHKFDPKNEKEFSLLHAILSLINRFVSLFKTNDRVSQMQSIVDELAMKIVNKDKIEPTSSILPENTLWFQVERKEINPKFKKQYVYFKRRLGELQKKIDIFKAKGNTIKQNETEALYKKITKSLAELVDTNNKQIIIDLGEDLLNSIEDNFIGGLESGKIKIENVKDDDFNYAVNTLYAFISKPGDSGISDLSTRASKLYERLEPFLDDYTEQEINNYATEEHEITKDDIKAQNKDIGSLTKGFGALADLGNYIARTIGSIIKAAQNKVSTKNKEAADDIKKQVDKLKEYADANGIAHKDMYNVFIQKYKGSTILTRKYTTEWYDLVNENIHQKKSKAWKKANAVYNEINKEWEPLDNKYDNENYKTIMSNEALKDFYKFHKKLTSEAIKKIPAKLMGGENFIANIKKDSLLDILRGKDKSALVKAKDAISDITKISSKEFNNGDFINDEELYNDVVPLKYINAIDSDSKSSDLGENLLTFVSFANSYEEMSEVLPKVRLLQEQIKNREGGYIKSNNPKEAITGENTNLYKMVNDYVKMQVKGEMKNDEFKIAKKVYDENGEVIGEKYIYGSDVIDFGLKYNSLLRIGLNPFNALTNVLIGDIGNIVEGFGGRFYTLKHLRNATNIYTKNAMSNKETKATSDLHYWLEKLNPLQELEDYENVSKVSVSTGVTTDKVKDKMYSLQRMGENFLQTRTMLAILIHDGYMTPEGVTTEKGKELDEVQLAKLSDKIQRVNQMIHGRYSSRDAATLQQSVLFRMASQFKKWIPAAIEARLQEKHYDNRLGVEVEGRYRTYIKAWNLMWAKLKSDHESLKRNEFTELDKYNMKKNLSEITIMLGTLFLYAALGWDDDKKKKQSPYFKFAMNQLDRVSGDLLFFYNPGELNRSLKSPVALLKTTGDLLDVIENVPYIFGDAILDKPIYTKGPRKGENKFWANFLDITPGAKPIGDVIRMTKKVSYQKVNTPN